MISELSARQLQSLAARGRALMEEVDQLDGKLSAHNLTKILVDDALLDNMGSFELEGRKTRVSYHAFYESIHKRWVEWANDTEVTMVETRGARSELGRFRRQRDQVNKLYSRREIDLSSISAKIKEQTVIVERLPLVALSMEGRGASKRGRPPARNVIFRTRFDVLVGTIVAPITIKIRAIPSKATPNRPAIPILF